MARDSDLDVAYVARLARLNLTEAETELFQKQLGDVLKYVEKLRELNVCGAEAAAHGVPIFNVFREDAPRVGFTAEDALSNAPRQPGGLCIVPKGVACRLELCPAWVRPSSRRGCDGVMFRRAHCSMPC